MLYGKQLLKISRCAVSMGNGMSAMGKFRRPALIAYTCFDELVHNCAFASDVFLVNINLRKYLKSYSVRFGEREGIRD